MNGSPEAGPSSSVPPQVNPSRTRSDPAAQVSTSSQPSPSGLRRGNTDGQTARAGTIISRQNGPNNSAGRDEGETWQDFLRRAPPQDIIALPPGDPRRQAYFRERKTQVVEEARKRRRAASSSTQRLPPPPPTFSRQHSVSMSYSAPRPSNSPSRHAHSQSRPTRVDRPLPRLPSFDTPRDSPGALPPWQPDSEVDACPICGRAFGMFFRRHHCRRCGRVVCAGCSPHRITIPKQFIVHPPEDQDLRQTLRAETGIEVVDLTGDEGGESTTTSESRNPALGGGQEVRLCNPCVPDPNPNPLPTPNYASARSGDGLTSFSTPGGLPHLLPIPYNRRTGRIFDPRIFQQPTSSVSYWEHGASGNEGDQSLSSDPSTLPPAIRSGYGSAPSGSSGSYFPRMPPGWSQPISHPRHPAHSSISSYLPHHIQNQAPLPPTPPPPPPPLREEDECPICHQELPPKGPDGSETTREAHVSECIASHFSSSAPRSAPQPPPETVVAAAVAANSATPAQASGETVSSAGARQTATSPAGGMPESSIARRRRRATGMIVYHASEKDCVGGDGVQQECVICFEEFQVGDEMGRLECLCKFHKGCIRSWWERKGTGSCPVHQDGI